jgi:phosphoglycolate phosphatase
MGTAAENSEFRGVTVVFDLDGTLVETAPDLIAAVSFVLAEQALPPVDPALLRSRISFGAMHMLDTALRLSGRPHSKIEIERIYHELYVPRYSATIAVDSRPFPGLDAALDAIDAGGGRSVVCTNKVEGLSRKLLDELGLSHRFAALAGRDTFAVCKPHADHLTGVVTAGGGTMARAIMVGDSDTDVQTARAAGVPCIGVTFGYTDVPMIDLGADVTIDHYDEFVAALRTVLRSGRDGSFRG